MANTSIFSKLLASSPYIEILVRHLYWKNIGLWSRLSSGQKKRNHLPLKTSSFSNIADFLGENGVEAKSILIVHSAYGPLRSTGKTPNQIIHCLMDLLSPKGTLAMPAMPKFENDTGTADYITKDISGTVFQYDTCKSPITTGVLPKALCHMKGAQRSRFPINTMVALGPLAAPMMEKNLDGYSPLPCGKNSAWNFCHENDAFILALGVDMAHTLTMIHVAEDLLDDKWPIDNWYRNRKFQITDGDFRKEVVLRERHPRWGTLHYAERTLSKDLLKTGIMKSREADGITMECLNAKALIAYLNSRNKYGYPYYGVQKYTKKRYS
jgi:aminoglycoside 3-N-acetyltransferase